MLVFDVGGTTIRAGVYDAHADDVIREARRTTRSAAAAPEADPDVLVKALGVDLAGLAKQVWTEGAAPNRIAVGVPGPLTPDGRVMSLPTVLGQASTVDLRLPDLLAAHWPQTQIAVLNDVTAAGYAVIRESRESFCVVTVSSGIGMKLFVDGQPVLGPNGRGGEVGHLVVVDGESANPCDCGGVGHLGAMASGRGVLASARRLQRAGRLLDVEIDRLDEHLIGAAFRDGHSWATDLIADAAGYLGRSLACLHTATGVERFVIVGGFAVALGESYRRLLVQAASSSCWDLGQSWPDMIELVDLNDRAGLLGAGRFLAAIGREVRT